MTILGFVRICKCWNLVHNGFAVSNMKLCFQPNNKSVQGTFTFQKSWIFIPTPVVHTDTTDLSKLEQRQYMAKLNSVLCLGMKIWIRDRTFGQGNIMQTHSFEDWFESWMGLKVRIGRVHLDFAPWIHLKWERRVHTHRSIAETVR